MATLFENIKNLFTTKEIKAKKESPIVHYSSLGYDVSTKISYNDLATDGYQQNAIVYRCVNEIANNASRVKIELFNGEQLVENHPILDLLYNPSPTQSQVEFFQGLYTYLLISGNSYILSVGGDRQPPTELYNLRPDRLRIRTGKRAMPLAYEYLISGQVVDSYEVDQATGNSKVKHIKLFNPLDDYYGMSPIQASSVDIDQHNLANKHNVNLLQNGARPSGAVIFKPKDETGGNVQLSEVQRNQLMNDVNSRFSGTGNAGKPMLLEGDFDWKEMGLSPKDMDFIQLKNMSAKDIALVYGVPSQLIGIPDAQTYSNFAEAKLALYNETIIPLLDRVQGDLNEWLVPQFNQTGLELRYDIDSIPAMSEQRRRVFESVTTGVKDGILTRNEAREQLGYEPVEGGDQLLVPANLMPLNIANETAPDDRGEDIPQEDIPEDLENEPLQPFVDSNGQPVKQELKKSPPYKDYPLTDQSTEWDGAKARKEMQNYAGGEDWDKSKYAKGFMWINENGDNLGDYKLPYTYVRDGKLVAVPKAIFSIASSIAGSRSKMKLTESQIKTIESHLRKYYAKLDMEPPFDKKDYNNGYSINNNSDEQLNGKENETGI